MAKRNQNEEVSSELQSQEENRSRTGKMAIPYYLAASMRLSSARPLGAPRLDNDVARIVGEDEGTYISMYDNSAVPGVAVLDYMPTLGVSKNANSALNRAAFNEFNVIRRNISGSRKYEPVDHMIYRLCVDSMHDLYDYIARVYTILSTYTATNLYRPGWIMAAMGLDYKAWSEQSANVYQWLVNHAGALEPFPAVEIGSISARHRAYNRCFYTDGDAPNAQTYVFNQVGFYSYEKVDEVKGITIRVPKRGAGLPLQPAQFFALWDEMYNALQSSSDVYTIAADIRNAMGDRVITQCTPPEVNENVQYLKLDAVLTSVMNATTVHTYMGISYDRSYDKIAEALRIYDGGNGILLTTSEMSETFEMGPIVKEEVPIIKSTGYLNHLNCVSPDPSADEILHATRFKPAMTTYVKLDYGPLSYNPAVQGYKVEASTHFEAVGTELIMGVRVYALDAEEEDLAIVATPATLELYPINYAGDLVASYAACSNFDWLLPRATGVIDYNELSGINILPKLHIVEDTQNYVQLDKDVLVNMIDSTLLAEFGIAN